MATDPTYAPSQHSSEFSTDHHLRPLRRTVRLVWPTEARSGPLDPSEEGTPHQLWGYIQTNPQWPWNIRVMHDGTVEQREGMTQDELNEAEYVLWGGHQYDMEAGSTLHQRLVSAGYEFVEV